MKNWRFGIVSDCYGGKVSIEDSIALLRGIGFRDLEIAGGQLVDDMVAPPPAKTLLGRLRPLRVSLEDAGMVVWQLHGPYGACDLVADSERTRRQHVDAYKRWIDIALMVGAKSLVIHIGGRNDLCPGKGPEAILEKNAESLASLAQHVGDADLKLAIENLMSHNLELPEVFNRVGGRISDLKELVGRVGSDSLGLCLDTGHANVEHLDIPDAIKECGELLVATHIQESNRVYDMHMLPFSLRASKSGMDWFRIFTAFKGINYPRPLIGECANTSGDLPQELVSRYLKAQRELIEMAMRGEFKAVEPQT